MDLNASYELCIIINRDMCVAIVYFVYLNSPHLYGYTCTMYRIILLYTSKLQMTLNNIISVTTIV